MAAARHYDGQLRWFVLNVEANVEVHITALDAMEELRGELTVRGVVFALARVKQNLLEDLQAHSIAIRIRIRPALSDPCRRRWRPMDDGRGSTHPADEDRAAGS